MSNSHRFDEEEEKVLKLIILVLGGLSLVLGTFVVVTFVSFAEKRKYPAWGLNVLFCASVTLLQAILMLGPIVGFDALHQNEGDNPYCFIQASLFMFFGSTMVWYWFFITINLFVKMVLKKDFNNTILVVLGVVLSFIMTLPPIILQKFSFAGAWCFIDSNDWILLFLDYYLVMGLCCVSGLFFWSAIIYQLYKNGQSLNQLVLSKSSEDVRIQTSIEERKRVFYRQLAFVTVFEITFLVFFGTRIQSYFHNDIRYASWIFHTVVFSSLGLYIFVIFGLKTQNFVLWERCLKGRSVRMRTFPQEEGYERIE